MDSSVPSRQSGPPADKLDSQRGSGKPKRGTLQIPAGLVTISKRLMWPLVLAVVPLVASTTVFNESYLAASYQPLPDRRPSSPTPFSFQNSTKGWNVTNQDLSNGSVKGHPPWQAMGNANHPETLGTRPQGPTSPVGVPPATMDAGMKGLHSSSGAISHSSTNILSDSLSIWPSDSSSRKAVSDQMTVHKGQELDITEPAGRVPSTSVTSLPFFVRSSSSPSAKISSHPTLSPLRCFTDSTISRRMRTHHQVESLKTSLFPLAFSPTTHSMSSPSTSIVGTQIDAKPFTQTEALLTSAVHHGAKKHSFPPGHDLSSTTTWINSSGQASITEPITQWPQRSNTMYDSHLRNANLSVTSSNPKAESSSDVATSSIYQSATEIAMPVPHSSETGVSKFSLSLATVQSDAGTIAVGMATEVNLSLGKQTSHPKYDLRSQDMPILPPGLDTTEGYEVSSAATEDTLSTSWTNDRTKLELRDTISPRGEEHAELYGGPTHEASSKGNTMSFGPVVKYWQPSTAASLDVVHSGTWYDTPVQQDSSLEAMTNTPSYWELVEMATTSVVSPIFSLELPLTIAESTPTLELASSFISVQPKAELAGQHYTLPQRWRDATPSPSDPTVLDTTMAEDPTELFTTKTESNGVVHMLSEGTGTTLASHPSQDTVRVTLTMGPTSPGMTHEDLHTGDPTASPAIELFSATSPQWKGDIPMPLHATTSLAETTKPERTSVVTTHGSASMYVTSLDSSRTSVPELFLEMHSAAAEKAQKEQEALEVTTLPRFSSSEDWQSDPKAVSSYPPSASIVDGIEPPILPTEDLYIDSGGTITFRTEQRYKSVDASAVITLRDDGTTLYIPNPDSSVYLPISETTSATTALLTTPKFLPEESKSTCSHIYCLLRTVPSSFTPSSTQLFLTSQPDLTRKVWVSTLGQGGVRKEMSTTTNTIITRIVAGAEGVTVIRGGHSSEQPESKDPVLSESTTKDSLISKTPLLLVPELHVLPLSFCLTGIDYFESLENKTSESYKKLAKEVQLTVNKMLSTYEGFLQTNILGFLNGSVVVKCEAVFQRRVPVPTPSDVIRTIATEVERWAMDTFFDWRLDIHSLHSNGFNMNNLEPEKLAISFTALELDSGGALGDVMNWNHLVTLLLRARYAVRNISFVESGNLQGGIDINGEVYIDTDIHVDVGWALEALTELSNYSVDLTSLSINGSQLSLHVFPISFLVTNRIFSEKMMDRSSVEHLSLVRDLSGVIMHVLGKYKNLLQVAIREITGGSLVCHGDVIFQHPAPTSKDILQTLALAVGPKDYLDSSTLQVDPYSFTVAGDVLEPPFPSLGIPIYAVVILALFVFALIALPILVLLPKMLGRKDKIIINRLRDLEGGIELFELDNPAFLPTLEEVHLDCLDTHMMMSDTSTLQGQELVWSTKTFSDGTMPHSI